MLNEDATTTTELPPAFERPGTEPVPERALSELAPEGPEPTPASERPVFQAGGDRRARLFTAAARGAGVLMALWLIALVAGALGFGTLPGVPLPEVGAIGKDSSEPGRSGGPAPLQESAPAVPAPTGASAREGDGPTESPAESPAPPSRSDRAGASDGSATDPAEPAPPTRSRRAPSRAEPAPPRPQGGDAAPLPPQASSPPEQAESAPAPQADAPGQTRPAPSRPTDPPGQAEPPRETRPAPPGGRDTLE